MTEEEKESSFVAAEIEMVANLKSSMAIFG